jgi:hypothetical protein
MERGCAAGQHGGHEAPCGEHEDLRQDGGRESGGWGERADFHYRGGGDARICGR